MKYLHNKIVGILMIVVLCMTFIPVNTYAERTCDQKKEDCYDECDEVYDGDSTIIEVGRATCKGGCQVAKLACNVF